MSDDKSSSTNNEESVSSEESCWELESFDFDLSSAPHSLLEEMKQEDFFEYQKPGEFGFIPRIWNDDTMGKLLKLFFFFHEKGIIWEQADTYICPSEEKFVRPLLYVISTLNIFKKLYVSYNFGEDSEEHIDLCPGISSNNFIEKLHLSCSGSMSREHSLAVNNLIASNIPCFQSFYVCDCDLDFRMILPGLTNNTTLKEFSVLFCDARNTSDEVTSQLVAALAMNPNLEELEIYSERVRKVFGDFSSDALKRLLSDSTSLRELILNSAVDDQVLNTECIIQGLKNNRSLKKLRIRGLLYGDLVFARFFRILADCPFLEYIHIDNHENNELVSEEDIAQVKSMPRLPRPIHLEVFACSRMKVLEEVLRYHPEVRLSVAFSLKNKIDFDAFEDDESNTKCVHLVNLNWHGRYLLDRPNVPLSIWPLVLEKVNFGGCARVKSSIFGGYATDKSSIIYELLKGPAWGGRTAFSKA